MISTPQQLWSEKQAQRRFERGHFLTLEAERLHVAETCLLVGCELGNITEAVMRSHRRLEQYVIPRHAAMTAAYELSSLGTHAIAEIFNRQDHQTILNAQRRVNEHPTLRALADRISVEVKARLKLK